MFSVLVSSYRNTLPRESLGELKKSCGNTRLQLTSVPTAFLIFPNVQVKGISATASSSLTTTLTHSIHSIHYLNTIDTLQMTFLRIFRKFLKIFQNCSEGQTNISKHFPNISEHFPKIMQQSIPKPPIPSPGNPRAFDLC